MSSVVCNARETCEGGVGGDGVARDRDGDAHVGDAMRALLRVIIVSDAIHGDDAVAARAQARWRRVTQDDDDDDDDAVRIARWANAGPAVAWTSICGARVRVTSQRDATSSSSTVDSCARCVRACVRARACACDGVDAVQARDQARAERGAVERRWDA